MMAFDYELQRWNANQNHAIKRDALSQMNSIAPKIGMSIDSRMKIFTPKPEKKSDDPFEVMLNAKKNWLCDWICSKSC